MQSTFPNIPHNCLFPLPSILHADWLFLSLPNSTQSTKKAYGGGAASNQTHTWGGGGAIAHLRAHQPAHPFIQDPAMPPLPPPNTLSQLEEACRRLEEASVSKPPKQR